MKVTTKTGDDQTTFLKQRRPKDDIQVEVLGQLDELLALCILTNLEISHDEIKLTEVIRHLQTMLGCLAVDGIAFLPSYVTYLEDFITSHEDVYRDLNRFVEANTIAAAKYNILRTKTRTLERRFVTLSKVETVDPSILIYLNRLSDYFFVAMLMTNA